MSLNRPSRIDARYLLSPIPKASLLPLKILTKTFGTEFKSIEDRSYLLEEGLQKDDNTKMYEDNNRE